MKDKKTDKQLRAEILDCIPREMLIAELRRRGEDVSEFEK